MPYKNASDQKRYLHEYHLKTWSKRRERHRKFKKERLLKLSIWLKTYKVSLLCSICSENHPACLDFHHTNPKTKEGSISTMIGEGYSLKRIQNEIKKCIVLCRNCHAKEHFNLTNRKTNSIQT